MDKYFPISILVFFIVLIPLVVFIIFKPMFEQKRRLNGVVNYDTFMRKFVFAVNASKEDVIKSLENKNYSDVLNYTINDDVSIIMFEKFNAKISYALQIEAHEDYCVVKTEQIPKIADRSNILYRVNEFWIKKLNAVPLDFNLYKF